MVWKYCTDLHFIQCKQKLIYNSRHSRNEKWEQSRNEAWNICFFSESLKNRAATGALPVGSSSSFRATRHTEHPPLSLHEEHNMDFMTVSRDKVHHLILPALNSLFFFSFYKCSSGWSQDRPAAPCPTFRFALYTLVARDWTSDFWVWALSVDDIELIWPCMAFFRLSRHRHWERKRRSKKAYKNGLRQLLT